MRERLRVRNLSPSPAYMFIAQQCHFWTPTTLSLSQDSIQRKPAFGAAPLAPLVLALPPNLLLAQAARETGYEVVTLSLVRGDDAPPNKNHMLAGAPRGDRARWLRSFTPDRAEARA